MSLGAQRLAVSPDGRRVVLAAAATSEVSEIALLEAGSGRLVFRMKLPGIGGIAFSPDGRLLVAGGFDGNVRVWDAASGGEVLRQRAAESRPGASVFDLFLKEYEDSRFKRGNYGTGIPVTAVAVSPDGSYLAAADGLMSAELRLWDMATKQPKWVAPIASMAGAIAFSPDGGRLVVACLVVFRVSH